MIKKSLLIAILSGVACSSSYSMDYDYKKLKDEQKKESKKDKTIKLETSDKKIVSCDPNLCRFLTTIHNVIEDSGDTSTPTPMPNVTESVWNLVHSLIQFMEQGSKNEIQNKLKTYKFDQLVAVLTAADYLDIRTPDNKIVLTDLVENEIGRQLLSEDSKKKFISSNMLDNTLKSIPDILSKKIVRHIMMKVPTIQNRIWKNAEVPHNEPMITHDVSVSILAEEGGPKDLYQFINKDLSFKMRSPKFNKSDRCGWSSLNIINDRDSKWVSAINNEIGIKHIYAFIGGTPLITSKTSMFVGHTAKITSVAFNNSGDQLISASEDGTIRIWEIRTSTCKHVLHADDFGIVSVAFNSAGDKVVSASKDRTIKIWDVQSEKCEKVLIGHEGSVYSAEFSKQGDKVVSTSEDGTVRIWDVQSGECVANFQCDTPPLSAEFNQQGDKIIVSTYDKVNGEKQVNGSVVLWDLKNGANVRICDREVYSASLNKKGNKIITAYRDTVYRDNEDNEDKVEAWDITKLLSIENSLLNDLTLQQALLLVLWDDALNDKMGIDFPKNSRLKKIVDSIKDKNIRNIIKR